jgi:hypothetical protein
MSPSTIAQVPPLLTPGPIQFFYVVTIYYPASSDAMSALVQDSLDQAVTAIGPILWG